MRRNRPERSEPLRSCIGCRRRRPQSALVRITRSERGIAFDGASDGRGAWLCRSDTDRSSVEGSCLDAAVAKRAFARAWRGDLTAEEQQQIETIRHSFTDSTGPGSRRRS